ncbi:hypothetical protein HPB50_003627 [Hyalomma asiaticum]|uniref:Uncharacterized protein n=1 Tax=Hyalomma asiaticum TaxID=266040 RepID=A0ACB7S062_HYAAI|nr:hypothetical protein HPB50_003627 [Hyalomma asiaticum]
MHGHLKLTGDVCRGVINNHETSESLQNKIQWRAGQLADIRKFGNSNVAALTFVGKVVPRFVHYNSENHPGLRAVPTTDGVKAPHECIPSCAVCGQAHATNSRDCKGKFRQLKVSGPKAKRPKHPPTRLPNQTPSHPTSGANGGAPRGAHTADPKTPSPPAPSVTSAHGKKTASPPPPPSGKDTRHFPAPKTDGAGGPRALKPLDVGKYRHSLNNAATPLPEPSTSSFSPPRSRSQRIRDAEWLRRAVR